MRDVAWGFRILLLALLSWVSVNAFGQPSCPINPASGTVTICAPADGATVGTTFHVNAGATDSTTIQYMQVYVAYKLYATQHSNVLDANITVAPGANQNLTVQYHDAAGNVVKSTIHVNVMSSTTVTISPTNPSVTAGTTLAFTANVPVTWTASCGSIDASGNFTAPLSQAACTVTAKATDGSNATASTNVTVTVPLAITPATAKTATGATQAFTASQSATWSASCGSIDPTGLFTAPATPGTCTITATASGGTPYTATAIDTVYAAAVNLNYTTWKFDNARDGLQPNETILSPANVNSASFGPLFNPTVDGWVWAQPLYMSGVAIGGLLHDAIFVATANDSVYAFDAENGQQLWKVSLLGSGETPANGTTIHSSVPKVGITGTPVIDRATATLYAVTQSLNTSGTYIHRLHAIDITTGGEKFGGPVAISSPGFDSSQHLQRPGLLLASGTVFVAFGGNGDIPPYHGWIFGYNAGTLAQTATWNDTPAGGEGGIWMGGAGIAADSSGNLLLSTGNGDWNGSTQLGQSVVKLDPSILALLDYFTPVGHVQESAADKDLGSGGVLLLPDLAGPHAHELIECSKLDTIYVLDRDNLGQIGASSDNVVQQVNDQLGGTSGVQYTDRCFTTPAYWNNNLYFVGNNDVLKQFTLDPSSGLMSNAPIQQGMFSYPFPGAQPVVSSNGLSNPIAWAFDWLSGTLRAYDAINVSNLLYVSPALGGGIKFTVPTVMNGHVYVGLQNKVSVLGVLPGSVCNPPASAGATICSPTPGTYSSPVTVAAAATPGSGQLQRIELWVDGKKLSDYTGPVLQVPVPLATGSHTVTAVEVDSTGATIKSAPVAITVH